jgi:hypothetical protein
MSNVKGPGRAIFAAVLLMIGGVLNVVYGIAAIGNSSFFVHHTHYLFGSLKTWGWVMLLLGILEILASLSLFGGGDFGRYFGIVMGSLAAVGALLDLPSYPFWSLAVFALSVYIVYGLTAPSDVDRWGEAPSSSGPTMHSPGPHPPQ